MRKLATLLALLVSLSCLSAGQSAVGRLGAGVPGGQGNAGGLLTSANFVYQGSFRLPTANAGSNNGFSFYGSGGQGGVAYNAAGNGGLGSLILSGSEVGNDVGKVAEVTIPALVMGDHPTGGSTNVLSLNTAAFLPIGCTTCFYDLTNGRLQTGASADSTYGHDTGDNGHTYGMLVDGGKLYVQVGLRFDADHVARANIFRHGLTLSVNDFWGWETVWDTAIIPSSFDGSAGVGMMQGYMSDVPASLQASLGGTAIASAFYGMSIISRTSLGPSAFTWTPSQVGSDTAAVTGGHALTFANGTPDTRVNATTGGTAMTSTAGAIFRSNMVGNAVVITGGTHWVPGTYTVAGFTNSSTITLDRDPTDGSNATVGTGYLGSDGSSSPVVSKGLLWYYSTHPTLGNYDDSSLGFPRRSSPKTWFSWGDHSSWGILEDATYFVGQYFGAGHATSTCSGLDEITGWYGDGTANWCQNGALEPDLNHNYAYDPDANGALAQHAWPYTHRIITYRISDLQAVKGGLKAPWDVVPVTAFDLPLPFDYNAAAGGAAPGTRAAYDRVHRNLYIVQPNSADWASLNLFWPLVHVYHLTQS